MQVRVAASLSAAAASTAQHAVGVLCITTLAGKAKPLSNALFPPLFTEYKEGDTVAILPGEDPTAASPHADIVICTGLGSYRNGIVGRSDAVIAVGGGAGTLQVSWWCMQVGRLVRWCINLRALIACTPPPLKNSWYNGICAELFDIPHRAALLVSHTMPCTGGCNCVESQQTTCSHAGVQWADSGTSRPPLGCAWWSQQGASAWSNNG